MCVFQFLRVRTVSGITYHCRSGNSIKGQMMDRFLLTDCRAVLSGNYRWAHWKLPQKASTLHTAQGFYVICFHECTEFVSACIKNLCHELRAFINSHLLSCLCPASCGLLKSFTAVWHTYSLDSLYRPLMRSFVFFLHSPNRWWLKMCPLQWMILDFYKRGNTQVKEFHCTKNQINFYQWTPLILTNGQDIPMMNVWMWIGEWCPLKSSHLCTALQICTAGFHLSNHAWIRLLIRAPPGCP